MLGLNKKEYDESLINLDKISKSIDCYIIKISEYNKNDNFVGEFLIRENDKVDTINIKIGVAGNVDSGKSTTVGTLTKGILDDGRGKARLHVFNYKHEVSSGRTSSIAHQIMGFDKEGSVVNFKLDRNNSWTDITCRSSKIISFYDLAGHEKYLRTTIYGLTSIYPDYCLIMIGANMGINHMTREHIGLCINLKIPFIILVTKIDIVPENVLEETMRKINNMCKNRIRKIPYIIKDRSDIISVIKNIKSDSIVPIIQISNEETASCDQDGKIIIWNIENGECFKTINVNTGIIWNLTKLSNNKIISCSNEKTMKVWDIETGNCLKTIDQENIFCLDLSN
jgi:GTPase